MEFLFFSPAPDKREYQSNILSYFSTKTSVVWFFLHKALLTCLMSTHNMFSRRNKKNINIFGWKKAPYLELCLVPRDQKQIWDETHISYLFKKILMYALHAQKMLLQKKKKKKKKKLKNGGRV